MRLESYRYGIFERLWLKLEARSFEDGVERLVLILPTLLFMQRDRLETLLDELPKILQNYLKPHLITRVFSHIVLRLQEFNKNEQLFILERSKAFECLVQHIQLYALVLDIFESNDQENLEVIEDIVRKKFDKDYMLNAANLRLLAYQEKHAKE